MRTNLCAVCLIETNERVCSPCQQPRTPCGNIEQLTLENTDYRRVQSTTDQQQLVLMSILPSENIPMEIHPTTTQFIKIESGNGVVIVDGKRIDLEPNSFIQIAPCTSHQVNVVGNQPLKLYTIYSPPEHPPGLVRKRQQ